MTEVTKWEYRVERFNKWSGLKSEEMSEALNSWGLEGWEVISTTFHADGGMWITAKRILTHSAKREREFNQI